MMLKLRPFRAAGPTMCSEEVADLCAAGLEMIRMPWKEIERQPRLLHTARRREEGTLDLVRPVPPRC